MRVALVNASGMVVGGAVVEPVHLAGCTVEWVAHGYTVVVLDDATRTPSPGDTYSGGQSFAPYVPPVEVRKAEMLAAVRARTEEIRRQGFIYTATNGARAHFTLDHNAVRQIMEAETWSREEPTKMAYPLVWPSVDVKAFVVMMDQPSVRAFALAYSLADRQVTEQGAALEKQVEDSTTHAQLDAIVDTRTAPDMTA